MKSEIRQILQMNKAGVITDEQAADLLAALAQPGPNSRTAPGFEWTGADLVKPIMSTVNNTLRTALDATFGGHGGSGKFHTYSGTTYASDLQKNAIHMSRFDSPAGEEYEFQGNVVRMSSVKELRLDHSEMTGNTIDMSKVDELSVKGGKLIDSEMRASSIEEMRISDSSVMALSVQGSKLAGFRIGAASHLDKLRVQGTSLKEFTVEDHVAVNGLLFNGAVAAELVFRRCELTDCEFQASSFVRLSFQDSRIANVLWRGMNLRGFSLSGCAFDDVLFSGLEKWGWKKRGFVDVRFENCRFNKVLFSNCRLAKSMIRNVTLANHKFQDLDLSGLNVDGNDAFLAAVGPKP